MEIATAWLRYEKGLYLLPDRRPTPLICIRPRHKPATRIGTSFIFDLRNARLTTLLDAARIVVPTHAASMNIGMTARALVVLSERQHQARQGGTTFPAGQIGFHGAVEAARAGSENVGGLRSGASLPAAAALA